ncbi:hypothetical protein S83_019052, partial [Arachis hypogaea]
SEKAFCLWFRFVTWEIWITEIRNNLGWFNKRGFGIIACSVLDPLSGRRFVLVIVATTFGFVKHSHFSLVLL